MFDKGLLAFALAMAVAAGAFSFAIFGITGLRVVFGIVFVSAPFFFILTNFGLGEAERFVFSVLMGITVFPSLVYLLGILISLRMAIIIVFAILIALHFAIRKFRRRH